MSTVLQVLRKRTSPPHGPVVSPPAKPPIETNELLLTPKGTISGGASIPIGVKITPAWIRKSVSDILVSAIKVALSCDDVLIANILLGPYVLKLAELEKDILFSTRISVPVKPTESLTKRLKAEVYVTPKNQMSPLAKSFVSAAELKIEYNDCAAANLGQLFLSVQPTQVQRNEVVSVKSIVPKSVPASRLLQTIDGVFNGSSPDTFNLQSPLNDNQIFVFERGKSAAPVLTEEVFFGFNFVAPAAGLLEMSWKYNKSETNLKAQAYMAVS